MSAIATIAIGVVFVLLIGEIDPPSPRDAVGGVVDDVLLRRTTRLALVGGDPRRAHCTTAIGFVQASSITKEGYRRSSSRWPGS